VDPPISKVFIGGQVAGIQDVETILLKEGDDEYARSPVGQGTPVLTEEDVDI
jgi:hypothetical protein